MKRLRNRIASTLREIEGFTLPEVLITIAILGILMGIAIPTWQSVIEGRRVDSAANQFASDVRLAHSRATNRLENWRVVHTVGSGSYQLVPEGGAAITRTLPEGTKVLNTEVAVGAAGDRRMVFNPRGQATATYTDDDSDNKIDVVISSEDDIPRSTIHVVQGTAEVELVS